MGPNALFHEQRTLITRLAAEHGTPFYLLEWTPILDQLAILDAAFRDVPVRHFYSYKTCPVPAVAQSWKATGRGIEVVSDFELRAALALGFASNEIIVNGVAKHAWHSLRSTSNLTVNFDSLHEIVHLAHVASEKEWTVGLRLHPTVQIDPDDPQFPDHFGIAGNDLAAAIALLHRARLTPTVVHMHLHSNVSHARFCEGLNQVAELCVRSGLDPQVVDCGGGLSAPGILQHGSEIAQPLSPKALAVELRTMLARLGTVREVWLENGRFLLAGAGSLVIRVLDIKSDHGVRLIVCDGGRTNHALVSDWEAHRISVVNERSEEPCLTAVCGPTCMAYDWLFRGPLPHDIMPGDLLVWHDAGAYHIPWETRFSHGLAPVLYIDESREPRQIRNRERFDEWLSIWAH